MKNYVFPNSDFNGEQWTEVGQTQYKHWQGDLTVYEGKAHIIGRRFFMLNISEILEKLLVSKNPKIF